MSDLTLLWSETTNVRSADLSATNSVISVRERASKFLLNWFSGIGLFATRIRDVGHQKGFVLGGRPDKITA